MHPIPMLTTVGEPGPSTPTPAKRTRGATKQGGKGTMAALMELMTADEDDSLVAKKQKSKAA